jgi:carboxypeptidase C (cathepsin A)
MVLADAEHVEAHLVGQLDLLEKLSKPLLRSYLRSRRRVATCVHEREHADLHGVLSSSRRSRRRRIACGLMSDDKSQEKPPEPAPEYEPPKGAETTGTWGRGRKAVEYAATAKWTVLRKKEKPAAEIFSVSYVALGTRDDRPVTFVFNGGPGASSAYLHMGAVGPKRVAFPPDGTLPTMPPRLVENESSWLSFSDLVFVDPVGTGFSRAIEAEKKPDGKGEKSEDAPDPKEYFGYKRDLESLSEFMSRWLSDHGRWGSPIFIAGESYGGYRVGRLVRMLQETAGIGLNGAILISPALEITGLTPTDYDVLGWVDRVPTMAAAAVYHRRSRVFSSRAALDRVLRESEEFATGNYAAFLTRGASMARRERDEIVSRLADLLGLPLDIVVRAEGRVSMVSFVRELLRDERKVLGLYDATITATDPFPDREGLVWPDPTLAGIGPAYTMAVNRMLRSEIGVETDREYALLSYDVFNSWKSDVEQHAFESPPGATDDFRYGMALNPHLKAYITHGRYDLVTPYFTTDRLRNLMRLDPQTADRLTVQHFGGGHMFYAWEASRTAFTTAIAAFIAAATAV